MVRPRKSKDAHLPIRRIPESISASRIKPQRREVTVFNDVALIPIRETQLHYTTGASIVEQYVPDTRTRAMQILVDEKRFMWIKVMLRVVPESAVITKWTMKS